VGGWDPFNVTEDADLGVRLARFGLGCATITSPTLEDAPETFRTWLPQRSRWLKGWMQTWLVHTRNPGTLLKELGPASFMVVQAIFAGVVVSSLVHPLMLVTAMWLGASLAWGGSLEGWRAALLMLDGANIGCAYASYLALGHRGLAGGDRPARLWRTALRTPAYWIAISAAAWLALFELTFRPHHWAKTEHKPSRPVAATAGKEAVRRARGG
jgi:Glycosyl transferase family group 2